MAENIAGCRQTCSWSDVGTCAPREEAESSASWSVGSSRKTWVPYWACVTLYKTPKSASNVAYFLHLSHTYSNKAVPPNNSTKWAKHSDTWVYEGEYIYSNQHTCENLLLMLELYKVKLYLFFSQCGWEQTCRTEAARRYLFLVWIMRLGHKKEPWCKRRWPAEIILTSRSKVFYYTIPGLAVAWLSKGCFSIKTV